MYNFKKYFLLFPIFILFYFAFVLNSSFKKPRLEITKQDSAQNFNNEFLTIFSLGQERLLSSILWVETMINSDIDHYKNNDLLSWMYLRFNTITDLTPKFYEPYLYGGIYLSIIKDDDLGAKKIYEKGINQFPNDYYLLLNSSFHYYYELDDAENAIKNLTKIKDHPKAASYIPSLIARLKSSSGDLIGAFTLLYETYRNSPPESAIKKKLANDLYSIKAELDLDCLNSTSSKTCQRKDFFGNDYIYKNGRYSSLEPFKPYRNKKGAN